METNNFALHNGKIVYVPEVPDGADYVNQADDGGHYDAKGYEQALQFSIANGIEVENYGTVIMYAGREDKFFEKQGQLHSLQCTVEIVGVDETGNSNCSDDNVVKEVARVTFEQLEKVAGFDYKQRRQETSFSRKVQPEAAGQEQEDNEYLERVLFVSLAQRDCTTDEGLDKAVEETFWNLKDKFTITRKP